MPYIGQGLEQGRRQLYTFTATASQTTFSASYTPGFVDVYQNGILLAPGDYTATSGTSIVLGVGAAVSDEITIIAQHTFTLADMVSASSGGTFAGDVTMAGNLTVQGTTITVDTNTAQTLAMGDADKIKLGDDGDLEIYHSGADSFIDDTGTGSLILRSGTTYIKNADGTKTSIQTNAGAGQTLYFNNSPKFETTNTGVTVTGALVSNGLTVDTDTLHVDSSNNTVGIGTAVPDGKLTIALENSNTPAFRLSSPTSSNDFAISSYNDSNGTYVALGVNYLFNSSGNDAIMDTNKRSAGIVLDGRNNGRIQFVTADTGIPTTRMTILKDGNVGIGIDPSTLPSFVNQAFKVSNGGGLSITSDNLADNRYIFFGHGTSSADIQQAAIKQTNTDLVFMAATVERLKVNTSGIDVSGSITADNQVKVLGSNASLVAFSVGDAGTGWYNAGSNSIALSSNGTPSIWVTSGGNVSIGGGITDYKLRIRSLTGSGGGKVLIQTDGAFASTDEAMLDFRHYDDSGDPAGRISFKGTSNYTGDMLFKVRQGGTSGAGGALLQEKLRLTNAAGLKVISDSGNSTSADNISVVYNGTAGGHKSGYLFRDKRDSVNAAVKNNLQDDSAANYAAHMEFQTAHAGSLTTQMTIDRYGQVMMPNQPSFRAYSSTDYTANGVLESANWIEQHDNNNDFSNGRFTAPVDGVYLFEVYWDSLSSLGGLSLLVNGGTYYVRWEPTGNTNNGWETKHYSTIIKLSSSDYVRLYGVHASGSNPFHMGNGHWGFFAGHLLG